MHNDLSAQNRKIFWGIIFAGIVFIFLAGSGPPTAHAQEAGTPQPNTDDTLTTPVETPQPGKDDTAHSIAETPQPGKGYADTVRLSDGSILIRRTINGPLVPPPGYDAERQAVELPKAKSDTKNAIGLGGGQWVFGCSPGAAADIAAELDRGGVYTNIWPEVPYPTQPVGDHFDTWKDEYDDEYPSHPLVATQKDVWDFSMAERPDNGTIEYYWVGYLSEDEDPYIEAGWEPLAPQSIGDYMFTSQSAYGNVDGETSYWYYPSGAPVTWEELESAQVPDGTLGLKRFYESRGYAVSEAYNQRTDNVVAGGFSYAQFKAEIDAGHPVLLGLKGHTIVGIGYDASSNLVYLRNGWDYDTHTMVWGEEYEEMELQDVSIVKLAPPPPIRSAGTYDDTDSAMVYGGIWGTYTDTGPYDGSIQYSNTVSNFASFTIQGRQFKLLYTGNPNRGNLDVYVDDVKVGTVNEYNASTNWQSEWISPELSAGTHLIRLVHTSGVVVDIDAVEVFSAPIPPPPALGEGTYDDTHSGLTYTGAWAAYADTGPYDGSIQYSTAIGNKVSFNMNGQQFILTYTGAASRGNLDVYVDTVKVGTVNEFNASLNWQSEWTSPVLAAGTHTVELVHTSGAVVDIDAVEVFSAPIPPPPALGEGTYDDTHSGLTYTGAWAAYADTGPYDGSIQYSTAIGNKVSFNMNGQQFILTYTGAASRGNLDVYVDTVKVGTVNEFNASLNWQSEWTSPVLAAGTHTVELVHTSGAVVDIDAVEVFSAPIPPPPALGEGTYDDTHSGLTYTGAWAAYADTGPYDGSIQYSTAIGNKVSFNMNGQQFILTYTGAASRGNLDVYVDTVKVGTVNEFNASLNWQSEWTSPVLAAGTHTVELVHTSGAVVDIDAVEVFSAPIPPPPALGEGTYDDTHSGLTYTGAWAAYADTGPYDGSIQYSTAIGNKVSFNMNGQQFILTYTGAASRGNLDVYVDTVKVGTVNEFNASLNWQSEWTSPVLAAGTHTVELVHTSGAVVDIDAVEVFSAPIPPPDPCATGTNDDTDNCLTYTGSWTTYADTGPYNGSIQYSLATGNQVSFDMNGQRFKLIYTGAANRGTLNVYVDDVKVDTLNQYNTSLSWQSEWTSSVLSAGTHTIKLVHASGVVVDIDAIEILP